MKPINKGFRILILVLILCFVAGSAFLYARAGGAGGGRSGSSGGGGGDGAIIFYIIMMLVQTIGPIPTAIVVIVVIILLSVFGKKMKSSSPMKNLNPVNRSVENLKGYREFISGNPGFSEENFKEKVSTAFIAIQEAWTEQNLTSVRRFISDGVYQRFSTQFTMMKLLKQTNPVDRVRIHTIQLVKIDTDGSYDTIDVAVKASARDKFVCESNHALDSPGGEDTFLEYWSFLRKRGADEKDMYATNLCPNCASPLGDEMGEVGKCRYCGVMVNSGEFDWVLSEITQADDYYRGTALKRAQNLQKKIDTLGSRYEDFAVQLVEDKASNGYLQIKTAWVMKDPRIMRRFVSDEAFKKITRGFPEKQIVYNRLYLNDVSLIGAQLSEKKGKNKLVVSVTLSYQRVILKNNGKADIIDPSIISETEILILERENQPGLSKGSLYTHTCPSCGGSVQDSLDINCTYCGSPLNSPETEWIITDVQSMAEYREFYKEESKQLDIKLNPTVLDSLYEVKDYALNNIMVMIGADGVFAEEEKQFAEGLARKWGYNPARIGPLFSLAQAGRLSIKMPGNPAKRKAIYQLMMKAAEADRNVCEEEKKILQFVQENYLAVS